MQFPEFPINYYWSAFQGRKPMQPLEMHFNKAIQKHSLFKQAATLLIQEIPRLTPDDIYNRCNDLSNMQRELTDNKDHLFGLMEFFGPGVLDTAFIGEFQRALEKSILTCDSLYAEVLHYKDTLIPHP